MNRFLKITILAAASLATVAAPLATASADSWSRHSWESKTWKRDSWGLDTGKAGARSVAGAALILIIVAGAIMTHSPPA